jgi:hypothetical protein
MIDCAFYAFYAFLRILRIFTHFYAFLRFRIAESANRTSAARAAATKKDEGEQT